MAALDVLRPRDGPLLGAALNCSLDRCVRLAEPALFPTVAKQAPSAFASRRKQDIKLVVTTIMRLAHPSECVGFAAHRQALLRRDRPVEGLGVMADPVGHALAREHACPCREISGLLQEVEKIWA